MHVCRRENGALTAEIEEVRDANVTLNINVTELRGSLKEALDARNLAEEQFQDLRDEHRMKLDVSYCGASLPPW